MDRMYNESDLISVWISLNSCKNAEESDQTYEILCIGLFVPEVDLT